MAQDKTLPTKVVVHEERPAPARLNRTLIGNLRPSPGGELIVMDSEVPGFGARVSSTGVRSYFVRYRVGGGRGAKMRRESLGRHPVMTPERARQAARNILAQARLGEDHALMKSKHRASLTVSGLVDESLQAPASGPVVAR